MRGKIHGNSLLSVAETFRNMSKKNYFLALKIKFHDRKYRTII
jgi:hypothetical protein